MGVRTDHPTQIPVTQFVRCNGVVLVGAGDEDKTYSFKKQLKYAQLTIRGWQTPATDGGTAPPTTRDWKKSGIDGKRERQTEKGRGKGEK